MGKCLLTAAMFALSLFYPAAAQNPAIHPHDEMNHWGLWGADDEQGATNFITPEAIVKAAKLVKKGKAFALGIPITSDGPRFPTRMPPHHFFSATGVDAYALPDWDSDTVQFTDDYITMPLQGSTQWDGLGHAFYGGTFYNGVPLTAVTNAGAAKLGIDKVKDRFVGRGVLIDVLRHKGELPPGSGISRADIEATLEAQKTKVEKGDIVLVRTGMVPAYYQMDAAGKRQWPIQQSGIVKDVIPWLRENQVAAIAADNLGIEQVPNADGRDWNLHGNLLRDLGIFLGEIWWLEELSEDCAEDGRYEFFLVAPPLNIPGAVGSPVNPIAIK